ncbi:hypothetical protein K432DRAFT_386120 [Lepidopterella palustris CBS 459.81]|uniref:Cell wall mannoprotein PIR1-like C-terminal domain-containing protein n=1 Tax=Lepidopterella palustris CBS 459.81 TaxID=1314670 RepID=A0A8E2E1E1_9PEZI|nr:hypothetical protein K432DRAFT_386120 [Lepidopterella palustris CBS 459.81]
MRFTIILSGLCLAASAAAQAVSIGIAPTAAAPPGCKPTYAGNFTLNVANGPSDVQRRQETQILASAVTVQLAHGILTDSHGRTGAIVANHQFQFDGPPQAGSIYTGGWSVCSNSSLALGGSTVFWECASGAFYNLYDISIGAQCVACEIVVVPVGGSTTSSSSSVVATSSVVASSVVIPVSGGSFGTVSPTGSASFTSSITGSESGNGTVASSTPASSTPAPSSATLLVSSGSSIVSRTALSATATTGGVATPTSTGGAVPTLVPGRDVVGAVAGFLGVAMVMY